MARLSPTTIRARVASTIAGALTGWTESRYAPPTFGRDTASILHLSYSVETPTTTSQGVDRQQRAKGTIANTEVVARMAYRLRSDNQVADYGSAMTAESSLLKAVLGTSLVDLQLRWTGTTRRVSEDFQLAELRFVTTHQLDLD